MIIPWNYVPRRVTSMMRSGELTKSAVRAAAMFVYLYKNSWTLHSIPTNFPRGLKVDTSYKPHGMRREHFFPIQNLHPEIVEVLENALIRETAFKEIAFRQGATITRHRAGKRLFQESLMAFERLLAS